MDNTNPLLARAVIPGSTFTLPSKGLFYTSGELSPDVVNGEISITAMTTLDELTMKSPDMLYSGKAVEEVFGRWIPQILKARDLLSKDVDYLMVCLRMVTYGPTLNLTYTHNCEAAKEHSYEVQLQPIIRSSKQIDPTTMAAMFTVTLPNGQVVKLKPTTFGAILALNQDVDLSDTIPSFDDIQSSVMTVLTDIISSVDDVDNKAHISEWIKSVSAGWIRLITDSLSNLGEWGASVQHTTSCKDCSKAITIEFSTNPVSFFS